MYSVVEWGSVCNSLFKSAVCKEGGLSLSFE